MDGTSIRRFLLAFIFLSHILDRGDCVNLDDVPSVTNSPKISTTTTTTTTTVRPVPAKPKTQRERLRAHLLEDYDLHAHPVKDHEDNVTVGIGMAIIHYDVDEERSVFSLDAWMRMSWVDAKLVWDPADYDNLTQIHFGVGEIWRPDILLYNSADPSLKHPYGDAHYVVSSDGSVLWVPPAHLEGFCKLSMRLWPLDTQRCKLKFGSWTSHGGQIDLELYKNMTSVEELNFYTNNREWTLLATTVEKRGVKYECCPQLYPDVTFSFILQRSSPSYRALLILPCLVIMLMTTCCFLLPPMAGEKVTANGFAFLSSVLYLIYFASNLPFHETEVPILVMFYSNTTAMIGIGLLLNVSCISMSRERKFQGPPKFLKALFAGTLGKCLCLGNYYHQVSSTHQRLVLELSDLASDTPSSAECGADDEQGAAGGGHGGGITSNGGTRIDPDLVRHDAAGLTNAEHSGVMKDWMLVAAGLERFFFVIYIVAFAIVTSVYV